METATPSVDTAILLPDPGIDRRSQTITYFVGVVLVWLVVSYSVTGLLSLYSPPTKEAYEFVTNMQAGLKDFILMALGGFLGAITQKHA